MSTFDSEAVVNDSYAVDADLYLRTPADVAAGEYASVVGAEKVVRMFVGGLPKVDALITGEPTVVNGNPALVLRLDGKIDGVLTVRVEQGRISGIYYVRNPEKLTRFESETPLTRR